MTLQKQIEDMQAQMLSQVPADTIDTLMTANKKLFLSHIEEGALQAGDRMPLIFLILFSFAVSMACGSQFPLALSLRGDKSSAAASFFSADLMGAACGTLITSVVMIPCLGIVWTAVGLICLKLASLTIAIMSHGKTKQTTFPVL
jgi:predicted membrane-bound spermidine synthase